MGRNLAFKGLKKLKRVGVLSKNGMELSDIKFHHSISKTHNAPENSIRAMKIN